MFKVGDKVKSTKNSMHIYEIVEVTENLGLVVKIAGEGRYGFKYPMSESIAVMYEATIRDCNCGVRVCDNCRKYR